MKQGPLINLRLACMVCLLTCVVGAAAGQQIELGSAADPGQPAPAGGGGDSYGPILSPDGRYVLFTSTANNLVLTGSNTPLALRLPPALNVFVRDRSSKTTVLVSASLGGMGANGDSLPLDISTNNRYVLFESSANDLVAGDTNNGGDVFVRDLASGATILVSVSTNGFPGNGASRSAAMTPDGRYVAFASFANDLASGDTNRMVDVYVRDLEAGVTRLCSVGALTTNRYGGALSGSDSPTITADGRYVGFLSTATNLVPGVPIGGDIYIRDVVLGSTIWASSGARAAVQAVLHTTNAVAYNHSLSADGRYVVYEANPAGSSRGLILRYGLETGTTELVETNAQAVSVAPYMDFRSLDVTPDGRFIAFVGNANGTNGSTTCVRVWHAETGLSTLASGDLTNAIPANTLCDFPAIDDSGRFVTFQSSATNLVTNALTGGVHIYWRDLQTGLTALVDAQTNGIGAGVGDATGPALSRDGRSVAFECPDSGLVTNDCNRNIDVFVRDVPGGSSELISARHPSLATSSPNGKTMVGSLAASSDGRIVAVASDAANFAPNDSNGYRDVFVRDLAAGTNALVSVATNGLGVDGPSFGAAISPDGRFVAFVSLGHNLVVNDTNKACDVFVRDLQSGTTALVSVNATGLGPGNNESLSPLVSAGGRHVLFRSKATDLAPVSLSDSRNLFLRDMWSGTTYALGTNVAGTAPAAMTPDGARIAFGSSVYPRQVVVWDSQAATPVYTNVLNGTLTGVALTPDGRALAFSYEDTTNRYLAVADLAAKTNRLIEWGGVYSGLGLSSDGARLVCCKSFSTNTPRQVYLFDVASGTSLLVSHAYDSTTPALASDSAVISPDGRFIAYRSAATNIVPNDTNGVSDVLLFDIGSGATVLLSASLYAQGTAANHSFLPTFSGDGHSLFFQSWASDLVPQDFNQWGDIFVWHLYASAPVPLFMANITSLGPGQAPWLTWPVVPGRAYRVQFKDTLSDAWQNLVGNVIVMGDQGYLKDINATGVQRFYRIAAF